MDESGAKLGSLSNNAGDGYENVTRRFKLYRAHSIVFNSSNVGEFLEFNSKGLYLSWVKEKKIRCLEFTSSTKRKISHFHVVVVQVGHQR